MTTTTKEPTFSDFLKSYSVADDNLRTATRKQLTIALEIELNALKDEGVDGDLQNEIKRVLERLQQAPASPVFPGTLPMLWHLLPAQAYAEVDIAGEKPAPQWVMTTIESKVHPHFDLGLWCIRSRFDPSEEAALREMLGGMENFAAMMASMFELAWRPKIMRNGTAFYMLVAGDMDKEILPMACHPVARLLTNELTSDWVMRHFRDNAKRKEEILRQQAASQESQA